MTSTTSSNSVGHTHSMKQSASTTSLAASDVSDMPPLSNPVQSFSNGFKSIVGSGVCALPYAFRKSGWLVGLIALVAVCTSSAASMHQLIACVHTVRRQRRKAMLLEQQHTPVLTYASTADATDQEPARSRFISEYDVNAPHERVDEEVVGFRQLAAIAFPSRLGQRIVDTSLLSCQLGGNCAFLSFIASSLHSVAVQHHLANFFTFNMIVWLLLPILAMLSMTRSTSYLAPLSHAGNFTLFASIGTVLIYSVMASPHGISYDSITSIAPYTNMRGVAVFFGISAFSVCAHAEVMAVESDSADRKHFHKIITAVMSTITICYALFGILVYAAFGHHTEGNIMTNLRSKGVVDVVKISMSLSVLVMYPLSLIPAVNAIEEMLSINSGTTAKSSPNTSRQPSRIGVNGNHSTDENRSLLAQQDGVELINVQSNGVSNDDNFDNDMTSSSSAGSSDYWKSVILRLALVFSTCMVTVVVNDFALLVAIVGSLAGGLLSFVIPPLTYYRLHQRKLSRTMIALLGVQLAFGAVLIVLGLYVAFTV